MGAHRWCCGRGDGDAVVSRDSVAPEAVQCSIARVSDEDDDGVFGSDDLLPHGGFGVFLPFPFFPFSPFSLGSDALWTATRWRRAIGRALGLRG